MGNINKKEENKMSKYNFTIQNGEMNTENFSVTLQVNINTATEMFIQFYNKTTHNYSTFRCLVENENKVLAMYFSGFRNFPSPELLDAIEENVIDYIKAVEGLKTLEAFEIRYIRCA